MQNVRRTDVRKELQDNFDKSYRINFRHYKNIRHIAAITATAIWADGEYDEAEAVLLFADLVREEPELELVY